MTSEEALHKAKALAEREGWLFREPARVQRVAHHRWEVISNAQGLGAKVRVVIDARSGEVLEKGYIPR